jgi:ribosome recycling factor
LKELLKEKEITEDEARKAELDIQEVTDHAVKKVDEVVAEKEKELLEI